MIELCLHEFGILISRDNENDFRVNLFLNEG